MAPRRQAKQPAAESVAVAADGNASPPKKRKTAKPTAAADSEPRQVRSRQAKTAAKRENDVVAGSEPASPPKKLRGKQRNAAASPVATAAKNDTKSRSKRQTKREPENAAAGSNAGEEVVEKKTRGGKTAEKAGAKVIAAAKPKARAPAARKPKTTTVENGDGDAGQSVVGPEGPASPAKRSTRRGKAVEESNATAQPAPAKATSRKRKNPQPTKATAEAQITKEKEEEEEENEAKVVAAGKKPRSRAKKMETNDAPTMTSKGRSKKNLAKETAKPEGAEIKKQNETKKGNAKKAAFRLNVVAEKISEAEEEAAPELAVEENGEAHIAEPKQKKRNAGKANAAANGKVETKGKQKKIQIVAASVNEKDATVEIKIETNTSSKIVDGNDTKDVFSSKDDNTSQSEEEKNDVNKSADLINSETKSINNTFNLEIPSNEVGSSESLLH